MGKGSNPVIGYWYGLGIHMGLCVGPVDQLSQIVAGGKQAWSGSQTASGTLTIDKINLFGGQHKEGGIQGTATILMGEPTQGTNAYLQSQLGTPLPAFRGLFTIVFRGLVTAMSPYLKAWSFQVSKWTKGWRTPVWQASLAKINEGMNPAHIVYRAVTDPVTGLGRDPATLDLNQMLATAQTLYNEGFGLNFKWSRSDVLANFVAMVCNHVGGDFVDDPTTGLEYLKLYRADYDINTCTVVDESNIIDLTEFDVPALAGAVNQVTAQGHDQNTNKDFSITVQNLANVQAQGAVIAQTNNYPGIHSKDLLTRVAMRDLRALSGLPARGKLKVLGTLTVKKGDVLAFSWARLNIAKMALRVLEIDRGNAVNSAMTLTCAQDVYDVPSNAYVVVQTPQWTPPNTNPAPVPDQRLLEASYRDLAANLRSADLAQVSATAGYVGALGDMPPCVATGYQLQTSIDNGSTWNNVGSGPFAPSAVLQASMVQEAGPTQATLISGVNLSLVKVPCEVLIDGEIMRCDAIDSTTGLVTLARGCVDTVPAAHTAGARVWFTDDFMGADPTEYITGETVQAKLLTQTGSGTLDPSQATTASVTLNSRQIRPYAPAISLNGARYPASVTAPVTVGLARRNRATQADQLIDATQGDITPEANQTTTVQFYSGATKLAEQTGITTNAAAPWSPAKSDTYTIKAFATRDSYTSWQTAQWTGTVIVPLVLTGTYAAATNGTAYSSDLTITGGDGTYSNPRVTTGAAPTGLSLSIVSGKLRLSGTPTATGTFTFTVAVDSGDGQTATSAQSVTVN